jgi:hypothetical protein
MKYCVWCNREFVASKGQIYCSPECRTFANAEAVVVRKEIARRQRRKAANKCCVVCGATLSMYGTGNTCAMHTNPTFLTDILKQIRKKV